MPVFFPKALIHIEKDTVLYTLISQGLAMSLHILEG